MEKLKKTIYENIWNYKGYSITQFGCGYTVFENGEEIFFQSIEDATIFIDTLTTEDVEMLTEKLENLESEKEQNINKIEMLENGLNEIEREYSLVEKRLNELRG